MKKIIICIVCIIATAIMTSSCSLFTKRISIDDLCQTLDTVNTIYKHDRKLQRQKLNDTLSRIIDKVDFSRASLEEMQQFAKNGFLYNLNDLRVAVYPRLSEIAQQNDVSGAQAAVLRVLNFPGAVSKRSYENSLKWAEDYKYLLHHPSVSEILKLDDRTSSVVFGRIQFLNAKAISDSKILREFIPLMDLEMSDEAARSTVQVFDEAIKSNSELTKDTIELIRQKALKKFKELELKLKDKENRNKTFVQRIITYLEGAYAKQKLIGNQAPELKFIWCSNPKIESLKDLKGKVVVLDFWATWCGPCVASFPNVAKLQERYKDYPVSIVGVTSIQGYHVDQKDKKRLMLKDKPKEEMKMMPGFMKDMGMSWNVAFSDKSCFNPDFGVRGIPHVAIVDAKGKVRYNMLRPYEAPYHEAEKIDALLKEANLPYPKESMSKENFSR